MNIKLSVDIKDLPPHEQRVVFELQELTDRFLRLSEFVDTSRFSSLPPHEQDLLRAQSSFMLGYCEILVARVRLFEAAALKKRSESIINFPDDYEV